MITKEYDYRFIVELIITAVVVWLFALAITSVR